MKETITVELSKEEIGNLVQDYIMSKYPDFKIESVSFDIGTKTELSGHYEFDDYKVNYLRGVSVSLKRE